jgi:hypothetical protein
MIRCDELLHPFQTDPGVSQRQRQILGLIDGAPAIDGRSLADLLDYFAQLSRHINYYDSKLAIHDWQPFFEKSIPFTLARIIKYDTQTSNEKLELYKVLFDKNPSKQGLQLLQHYIYYSAIYRIQTWQSQLQGSELPIELQFEQVIKDKLQQSLKTFICLSNHAVKHFGVKRIDFSKFYANEAWGLESADLYAIDEYCSPKAKDNCSKLNILANELKNLYPSFIHVIQSAISVAEMSIGQSLIPLKEELQKQHTPHLALIFAFLRLFKYLQNDLNRYTRKHLDFFYREVLKLNPRDAVADKAHIVFEIQKQLDKYLLQRGLLAKDGKDRNKAEIFFSLDDEIVVNKTELAETRTLFLNNKSLYDPKDKKSKNYAEGLYIAPDARKADGVAIDFKDNDPKNWPTLGAKYSKYIDPEKKIPRPYPHARLGFILASPVLLLNEGKRTVNIQLACRLDTEICDNNNNQVDSSADPCCNHDAPILLKQAPKTKFPKLINPLDIIDNVNKILRTTYRLISQDLIDEAAKKGLDKEITLKIRSRFLTDNCHKTICCDRERKYISEIAVREGVWIKFLNLSVKNKADKDILEEIFLPRRAFKIYFSGEKEWIEPSRIIEMKLVKPAGNDKFVLNIRAELIAEKPAITFYDKEKLKEDFGTSNPLVKVELDNGIGLILNKRLRRQLGIRGAEEICCLSKSTALCAGKISLYDFFKYARIVEKLGNNPSDESDVTKIDVRVCGLKNFIVQNDESLQDVNAPIYPFGTRPDIIDFDVVNPIPVPKNLVGPNFYIGSVEIFCKKWNEVFLNINWKDKPTDFREYYKAYVLDKISLLFGLDENKFQINIAVLNNGEWVEEKSHIAPDPPPNTIPNPVTLGNNRLLFKTDGKAPFCVHKNPYEQTIYLKNSFFDNLNLQFRLTGVEVTRFNSDTRFGFLKINLQNQDFCHKNYAYVLARQMTALGKLPKEHVEDAVYYIPPAGGPIIISTSDILDALNNGGFIADRVQADVQSIDGIAGGIAHNITLGESNTIRTILRLPIIPIPGDISLNDAAKHLDDLFNLPNTGIIDKLTNLAKFAAIIPNEPWTPIIKNSSLDYTATAYIKDVDLIHLYPYQGTYKHEEIELQPTLFPSFCDEGTLYIGLKNLVPGSNLHILFQLAEATADSESEMEEVVWQYLDTNQWKTLRNGFEVLEDATDDLTVSGIVKLSLPENMTKENTILPKEMYWIKASVPLNSRSVSETIGIHLQAIRVTFTKDPSNDLLRLNEPLAAGSISTLKDADANIKKLEQPYESFDGRLPELEGQYYVRVSELLRHKGRAIQKFDYERLTLEAFPKIFKAKCINHSYALDAQNFINDFPIAPGYVILAVIPDLYKLKTGETFQPKVPVNLLERIQEYLYQRSSPFVRLRVMNPRYEKIHFCLKVKLYLGKDENYYKEKLKEDLREFLAPWAVGEYDKLSFGQCVNRSDLIRLLETRDYVDYIIELKMGHEMDLVLSDSVIQVCPKTPRSILIAGEIDVCIKQNDCEEWNREGACENKHEPVVDYCRDSQ